MGKFHLVNGTGIDSQRLKALDAAAATPLRKQTESETVILKATYIAIKNALHLLHNFSSIRSD